MNTPTLTFQDTALSVTDRNGSPWLASSQVAKALGYKDTSAVSRIYRRNKDEFTPAMTETVNMTVSGNLRKDVRIFSLRGCHLVAMFSRTEVAKSFRKWVLDLLDKQTPLPVKQLPPPAATLSSEQQHEARKQVAKLAREGELQPGIAFSIIWTGIKDHFKVASCKDIPSSRFPELMKLLGSPLEEAGSGGLVLTGSVLVDAQSLKGTLDMVKRVKERSGELWEACEQVKVTAIKHQEEVARMWKAYSRMHDVLQDLPCYARGLCLNR